jgi:hypothetical protein
VNLHGREHEWLIETHDALAYDNIFPPVLGLIGIGALVCAMWAFGPTDGGSGDGLARCLSIANDQARLACYDHLATPHPPAKGAFAPAQDQSREASQ